MLNQIRKKKVKTIAKGVKLERWVTYYIQLQREITRKDTKKNNKKNK